MTEHISVNSHSSIRIEGEQIIYIDPFEITSDSKDADLIFITHDHYDHFSPEAIEKIQKDNTIFVCPENMTDQVKALGIETDRIVSVIPGKTYTIHQMPVDVIPAYNREKPFHTKDKAWVGYILTVCGKRIYIAGDTDYIPEHQDVRCDIALVPVGGHYTMDAEAAADCVNAIMPETAVPTHYGSIVGRKEDGEIFKDLVNPEIKVVLKIHSV